MNPLMLTLYGQPRTKKNSGRIIDVHGKDGKNFRKLLPSEAYAQYEKDCAWQITGDKKQDIDWPVNVKCVYYMKTRGICDLVNLQEGTLDLLVHAGVLHDDNHKIVVSMDGSRVLYDKKNPRVEITITDISDCV